MRQLACLALLLTACAAPSYQPGLRRPIAVPPGVAYRQGRIVSDVDRFWEAWLPPAAPRALLVVVHGLKDHADRYAPLAEALVPKGIGVYAMDLRGHGDSQGDRVWVDIFDEYTADVQQFIHFVEQRHPGTPIYLFGHSMGGAIATLVAMRMQPPQLAGLVLSAPALEPTDDVTPFLISSTHALGSLAPSAAVFDLPDAKFSRDPKAVAELAADPLVYHGKAPARTASELLTAMDRIQHRMERLFLPLLVMHGTKDELTNPRGSQDLVRRASSADKTLKLYPGLFHDLWHEPEKAQVTADLVGWLDRHAP